MYITNVSEVALIAEKHGVDRIWVDLETLGKQERQKGLDCVKSNHTVADVARISKLLTKSKMLVRVNPWNINSQHEINEVIDAGAQLVMLPMWKTIDEVRKFVNTVNGRAKTILLLETKEAEFSLDEVLDIEGIDEIHIGLNDLHLSYGLPFMFQLLSNGTVERICNKIANKGIPYGFGGISKIGDGLLPAENILIEHARLNSSMVILSRGFCNPDKFSCLEDFDRSFAECMHQFRAFEKNAYNLSEDTKIQNREILVKLVDQTVKDIVMIS